MMGHNSPYVISATKIDLRYINTKLVDIGALPIPYIPYLIINNMTVKSLFTSCAQSKNF